MNLEAYDIDNLRVLFRKLEKENLYLKALLDKAVIQYAYNEHFDLDPTESVEYDADQSSRVRIWRDLVMTQCEKEPQPTHRNTYGGVRMDLLWHAGEDSNSRPSGP